MWLVERLKFNNNIKQYEFDGTYVFNSDEELMNFIKNVMVYAGRDYLWRITKTQPLFPEDDRRKR